MGIVRSRESDAMCVYSQPIFFRCGSWLGKRIRFKAFWTKGLIRMLFSERDISSDAQCEMCVRGAWIRMVVSIARPFERTSLEVCPRTQGRP